VFSLNEIPKIKDVKPLDDMILTVTFENNIKKISRMGFRRCADMKVPSIEQAFVMLNEAEKMYPGPWVAHSKSVAENARNIANNCDDIDSEIAFVFGLLHDIGRREGVKEIMHIFDGYYYLMKQDFKDAANICLTHSFPIKDSTIYFGRYDCSHEELLFLKNHLKENEYTDYDKLIQLCDAISMPNGAVLMEKRFVDVATRHGLPDFTLRKWQGFINVKKYFDQKAGANIYSFLPNIVENTFGFNHTYFVK
jgi:HD superfamily phosphohydrolase YqeK